MSRWRTLRGGDALSGYKHVHCRYQVLGYIGVEGEIVDVHQRRADAMRHAAACLGPRGYERTEVYDSMARRGEPNLWSVDQDGTTCVSTAKPWRGPR